KHQRVRTQPPLRAERHREKRADSRCEHEYVVPGDDGPGRVRAGVEELLAARWARPALEPGIGDLDELERCGRPHALQRGPSRGQPRRAMAVPAEEEGDPHQAATPRPPAASKARSSSVPGTTSVGARTP